MTSDSAQRLVGQQIGAYRVTGVLGRGGMGIVLRARQESLERDVALKLMLELDDADARARFLQEAQVVARLQHPGVLGVIDAGEHQGRVWFAMALAEGKTLAEELPHSTPRRVADLLGRAAQALGYVHSQGLIHRDLKPSNIMLDAHGQPLLMDFGLVKDTSKAGNTMEGSLLGTPAFMSPEQAGGELSQVDHRTDIYALGAILYTALAGRPPYEGASTINIITAILKGPPARPSTLASDVPPDLERICQRAMAPDKEDRYPTANDMSRELLAFARGDTQEAPTGRRTPLLAGAFVALAALVALALVLVFASEEEGPRTEGPAIGDSSNEDPTTEDPTTVDPTTEDPTTVDPTTVDPTTVDPTTEDPTTEDPTTVLDEPPEPPPSTEAAPAPSVDALDYERATAALHFVKLSLSQTAQKRMGRLNTTTISDDRVVIALRQRSWLGWLKFRPGPRFLTNAALLHAEPTDRPFQLVARVEGPQSKLHGAGIGVISADAPWPTQGTVRRESHRLQLTPRFLKTSSAEERWKSLASFDPSGSWLLRIRRLGQRYWADRSKDEGKTWAPALPEPIVMPGERVAPVLFAVTKKKNTKDKAILAEFTFSDVRYSVAP